MGISQESDSCCIECRTCKQVHEIPTSRLKVNYFRKYRHSRTIKVPYIQDYFPELDADQREIIMSGICGKCFDDMWSEPDFILTRAEALRLNGVRS